MVLSFFPCTNITVISPDEIKPVDKRLLFRYPFTEDDTEQKKNDTEDDELSYFNNSGRSDCCDQRDLMVGMFVFF